MHWRPAEYRVCGADVSQLDAHRPADLLLEHEVVLLDIRGSQVVAGVVLRDWKHKNRILLIQRDGIRAAAISGPRIYKILGAVQCDVDDERLVLQIGHEVHHADRVENAVSAANRRLAVAENIPREAEAR